MIVPPLPEPRLLTRAHVNGETIDHLGYTVETMVEWRRQLVELAAAVELAETELRWSKVREERESQRLE